jgi:ribosomal protein S8
MIITQYLIDTISSIQNTEKLIEVHLLNSNQKFKVILKDLWILQDVHPGYIFSYSNETKEIRNSETITILDKNSFFVIFPLQTISASFLYKIKKCPREAVLRYYNFTYTNDKKTVLL